jgi:hypothetical protein
MISGTFVHDTTLTRLGHHLRGGVKVFRRYRIIWLEKSDCPDALKHFWSGHAQRHEPERYTKLLGEREYRLEWAERVGLGFTLPESREEIVTALKRKAMEELTPPAQVHFP